jgi:protein O-mannosyl-transferase
VQLPPQPQPFWSHLIVEKLPLLALSAASCVVTLGAQRDAIVGNDRIDFSLRLANTATSLVGYLTQWLYPANLAAMYPYPLSGVAAERVAAAALLLAAISLAALIDYRRYPFLLVGWLWYLGMLVPVVGLVQVGSQAMADRYTYLPQIGLAVALTWLAAGLLTTWPRWRLPAAAAACLILLELIVCASLQISYWQDSKTLWTHALSCTTDNWMAHSGLGSALLELNDNDRAVTEFEEAVKIRPGNGQSLFYLGRALERRGKPGDNDAAIAQYRQAIARDPTLADAHYNLGVLLASRGSTDKAIAEFKDAIKYKPQQANAHYNLAVCLENQGKYAEAMPHWTAAAELQPGNADAIDDLAWRLATYPDTSVRNGNRAIELARQAIEISKGQAAKPLATLAAAYAEVRQFAEAVEAAKRAIDVAVQHGETADAEDIRAQMKLYRAHHPYHGSPGQPQ